MTGEGAGPMIGAVADDLTGATDLAGRLVRAGVPTAVHVGLPRPGSVPALGVPAVVVAAKIRTAPAAEAMAAALAAAGALREAGAGRLLWKYCSTFDSTPAGNIGPVADALGAVVGQRLVVACPAFPANGRTVYQGHLFVHGVPLADSPMARHPLTPMTDSDLVRWLGRQTPRPVGLVGYEAVAAGRDAIRARLEDLRAAGCGHAVVDALDDRHLATVADAVADDLLVGGGSAIGGALVPTWRDRGLLPEPAPTPAVPVDGPGAVVVGSCSTASRQQVVVAAAGGATTVTVDPRRLLEPGAVEALAARACAAVGRVPVVVTAAAPPEEVAAVQHELGPGRSAAMVEQALARTATALVAAGVRRLVVAGGETAGAVVAELGRPVLHIGRELAPGVPVARAAGDPPLALALKSGNFGGPDFFAAALAGLGGD